MIDLHCHLLPSVDDGPKTMEAASALCKMAADDGIETIVVTPHQRHPRWPNRSRRALEQNLVRLKASCGDRPELLLGAEVAIDSRLLEEADLYPYGELLTLAGTTAILCEPSRLETGLDLVATIHELVVLGFRPLLAHPERISWIGGDLAMVRDLVAAGALMQVTGGSLLGDFGRKVGHAARALMDAGLVHLMASDGHDGKRRRPVLSEAARYVAEEWGDEAARRLVLDAPRELLETRPASKEPVRDQT